MAHEHVFWVTPDGSINGTNTAFTISATFKPYTLRVLVNGVELHRGTDFSETSTGAAFVIPPRVGDAVRFGYEVSG